VIAVGRVEGRQECVEVPERGLSRLGDQGFLGGELLVEAARGQPDGLHQIGDADAVHAALPEELGGRGDRAPAVLDRLCLRNATHHSPAHVR
jgi:hypothetical protein